MDYIYILREALVWIVTIFWLYQNCHQFMLISKIKRKTIKK